jgi:predicted transcriptional regulator
MLTKDKIKKAVDNMPDDFSIEDVIEELIVVDKIEQGLEDVLKGRVYSNEEARKRLKRWLR